MTVLLLSFLLICSDLLELALKLSPTSLCSVLLFHFLGFIIVLLLLNVLGLADFLHPDWLYLSHSPACSVVHAALSFFLASHGLLMVLPGAVLPKSSFFIAILFSNCGRMFEKSMAYR